ncbi:MAG: 1-acyl-sn-glycerol-3-phosphate acyltransferase [Blastococcus sp.]|nr:1-acyl-sn-glycerol-3-phosphate acyltransferase [Blastococcus sp.]
MYTASWRDVVRSNLYGPSPDPRDRPYRSIIRVALAVFRLFRFRFDVRGSEHVPASGGAIICSNHVSYFDFTYLGLAALPQHRLVRFMAKAAVFDNWFAGRFMRAMKHIPVDRRAGTAAFESAVRALKDGEIVGVFPEATISESFELKEFKTGAARMAMEAGVPLLPTVLWGSQRVYTKGRKRDLTRGTPIRIHVGEPFTPAPGSDPVEVTAELKARLTELLEHARATYAGAPRSPDDTWWVPKAMGGTAPTVEEAAALEAERKAAKAARRAAKER